MKRTIIPLLAVILAGCGTSAYGSKPGVSPPATDTTTTSAPTEPDEDSDHEATVSHGKTACGVERWAVKTGSDPDVSQINLTKPPKQTTVAALTSLKAPNLLPPDNRVKPTETTVYTLHATLTGYKLESDSDFHLILSDAGRTMIAEIPSPSCTPSDPLKAGITNARKEFTALYTPDPTMKHLAVPVTVTGIGFLDSIHGQAGVALNGAEIHPVLDINFN